MKLSTLTPFDVGSWVTITKLGIRGSKARRDNVKGTPALITNIGDGVATLVYANELVLLHGFVGPRMQRIVGVAVEKLAVWTGPVKPVQQTLIDALKLEIGQRLAAPCGDSKSLEQDDESQTVAPEADSSVSIAPQLLVQCPAPASRQPASSDVPAPPSPTARARERSRTPQRRCRMLESPILEARASGHRVLKRLCSGPRTPSPHNRALRRADSDEKRRPLPHAIVNQDDHMAEESAPAPIYSRKRHDDLTQVVGKEFARLDNNHVPQADLVELLAKAGFTNQEIQQGFEKLDDQNKVLLMDGLVVRIDGLKIR